MSCSFCNKVRSVVRSVLLTRENWSSWYLKEFKRRFNPHQHLLYVRSHDGIERVVPIAAPVNDDEKTWHYVIGTQRVYSADAIANLTTGKVLKSRHTDSANFEAFFNRYIRNFDKLEELYVEFLRRERQAEMEDE